MTEEAKVIAVEYAIFEALQKQDPAALARVLAPEFIYRSPGAPDVNAADFVKGAMSLPGKVTAIEAEGLQCHIYGETAVLTGVQVARIQLEGANEEVTDRSMFTDILVRRHSEWLLVLAHCAELPPISENPGKSA